MRQRSKIKLSKREREALSEHEFFSTKKIITQKIYQSLANIVEMVNERRIFSRTEFPKDTDSTTGKISKGENYLGLPFLILDFPRNFHPDSLFTIRTMIWWGNFLSSSLLLSGKEFSKRKQKVLDHYDFLSENNVGLCINNSPWHHHFEEDNFVSMKKLSCNKVEELLSEKIFLKLGRKIPIRKINQLEIFALESFEIYSKVL
jgi:hypothetical protein